MTSPWGSCLVGCSSRNAGSSHFTAECFARMQARTKILSTDLSLSVFGLGSHCSRPASCMLASAADHCPNRMLITTVPLRFPTPTSPISPPSLTATFLQLPSPVSLVIYPTASCCNLPFSGASHIATQVLVKSDGQPQPGVASLHHTISQHRLAQPHTSNPGSTPGSRRAGWLPLG